jgi:hypothetical protein
VTNFSVQLNIFNYDCFSMSGMMPVQACIVSCCDGAVECALGLLVHHSPSLAEMFGSVTCLCTKAALLLPDQSVDTVALALRLLQGASGGVTIEFESLLPAMPVLTLLGVTCSYDVKVGALANNILWLTP